MKLHVKLRNIDNLDLGQQILLINKYLCEECNFKQLGIELVDFIDHNSSGFSSDKNFAIGSFIVKDKAKFDQIALITETHKLHEIFIIFIEF